MATPPHVEDYLRTLPPEAGKPLLLERLDRSAKEKKPYNLLYRVSDDIWVHIREGSLFPNYIPPEAGKPLLLERLDRSAKEKKPYNLLYRVSDDIWVHIREGSLFPNYIAVE